MPKEKKEIETSIVEPVEIKKPTKRKTTKKVEIIKEIKPELYPHKMIGDKKIVSVKLEGNNVLVVNEINTHFKIPVELYNKGQKLS